MTIETSAGPPSGMDSLFQVLGTTACVALLIFGGAYAFEFGLPVHFAWSQDAEAWEHFGAYLGGVLGPIYGLLAFIGVLITVLLQRRQIDDLRAQSTQQALQQLMATVSGKIDTLLRSAPLVRGTESVQALKDVVETITVGHLIRLGANLVPGIERGDADTLKFADVLSALKQMIRIDVADLASELDQLVACLARYDAAGGPTEIGSLYRARYARLVHELRILKVELSKPVTEHFVE